MRSPSYAERREVAQVSRLSGQVLRAVLDTAGALAALDTDAVRAGLPELARLLGGDLATYHRLELPERREHVLAHPAGTVLGDQLWAGYSQQLGRDPLTAHYLAHRDPSPRRISDVIDPGAFRRTALYQEYYRRVRVEHQVALPIRALPGQAVGFTVCRSSGNDFTLPDLEVLALLGPHLARLHRQHQQALPDGHAAVSSPVASPQQPVPEQRAAASPTLPPQPATQPPHDHQSTRHAGLPGEQTAAALTSREQQILRLVGNGHTSASIARELDVSSRTVDKHLENAYRKLGVSNRAAAVASTLRQAHRVRSPSR